MDSDDPMAAAAVDMSAERNAFLARAFPPEFVVPYQKRWLELGPLRLLPPAPVRTHRFGQAFEMMVSLGLTHRWPDGNAGRAGFGHLFWLPEVWADPDVRRCLAEDDHGGLAGAAMASTGLGVVGEPRPSFGHVDQATFDAYVADMAILYQAFLATLADTGLADMPAVVGVEDVLIDDLLIDIKVYSRRSMAAAWITAMARRLIDVTAVTAGVTGLSSAVQRVGFYSARHPALVVWPVEEFLAAMSGGRSRLDLEGDYEQIVVGDTAKVDMLIRRSIADSRKLAGIIGVGRAHRPEAFGARFPGTQWLR
ncbi:MAG TPA: hypothetical protein VFP54_05980 [Acidimicrobiales bacterium]|nr:hypothetical protein [Acidimicrobiales bacterium]